MLFLPALFLPFIDLTINLNYGNLHNQVPSHMKGLSPFISVLSIGIFGFFLEINQRKTTWSSLFPVTSWHCLYCEFLGLANFSLCFSIRPKLYSLARTIFQRSILVWKAFSEFFDRLAFNCPKFYIQFLFCHLILSILLVTSKIFFLNSKQTVAILLNIWNWIEHFI